MTITREQVMRALAQGYMHDRNAEKELDVDLLVAMADEVMKALEEHGAVSTTEEDPDGGGA
jgi:hypothetical protein